LLGNGERRHSKKSKNRFEFQKVGGADLEKESPIPAPKNVKGKKDARLEHRGQKTEEKKQAAGTKCGERPSILPESTKIGGRRWKNDRREKSVW